MLPLGLLTAAQGHPMLVELKNGETLNGHLVTCDTWMNLTLKEVVQTSPEGDKFFRLPEVYVKGNNIKYLRVPDEIIDLVKDQQQARLGAGTSWTGSLGSEIPSLQKASPAPDINDSDDHAEPSERLLVYVPIAVKSNGPKYSGLDDVPSSTLHDQLWQLRLVPGSSGKMASIVRYLIEIRGEEPTLAHYDALIRANADPEMGSITHVVQLLTEMEQAKIGPDSSLYHGVMQVLTNHPHFILRNYILQQMKDRWLSLMPEGQHNLIVSLLRERQLEMAMEELEKMEQENISIPPWLYNIFIFQLCDCQEFDEALRMLRMMVDQGQISTSDYIWHYLLDTFSAAYHYEGTNFIWQLKIATRHFNPCDGTCTNVLNIAARYSDAELATSVLSLLSERKTPLSAHQYEAVIEAYINSSDMKTAFHILNIMVKAGEILSNSTTRPIYQYLVQDPATPEKAWRALETIQKEGGSVPTVAANVVIEAVGHFGEIELAVALYKEIHKLCSNGPNIDTFNVLLQALSRTEGTKEVAMFLAAEMRDLRIKPNRLTYDRMILICLGDDDYEDAFNYLDEMVSVGNKAAKTATDASEDTRGWWMRRRTAVKFLKRLDAAGDKRVLDLIDEWDKRDIASDDHFTTKMKERAFLNLEHVEASDFERTRRIEAVV
ncbi:pentatricopeptide repeat protein [Phlyctema vagabunda]|uniref:Pentatricopeptide repeat protein n=1 Tax=Phlyctema vagabunda TaxID=108571 RepID=A0ABR4P4S5_9HELO